MNKSNLLKGLAALAVIGLVTVAGIRGCQKMRKPRSVAVVHKPVEQIVDEEPIRQRKFHIVENGDLYFRIADKYGVTVSQLRRWNPRYGLGYIAVGDTVYLEGK